MELTPPQERAVAWDEGPLLVLGPAGSGKSEVLARRLARIAGEGLGPEPGLVLTSTRANARRLGRRVEALLSGSYEELWIGTWEEVAERLLREHSEAAGPHPFFEGLGRGGRGAPHSPPPPLRRR